MGKIIKLLILYIFSYIIIIYLVNYIYLKRIILLELFSLNLQNYKIFVLFIKTCNIALNNYTISFIL